MRSHTIMLRLNETELAALNAAREAAGTQWVPLASWVRKILFTATDQAADVRANGELPAARARVTKRKRSAGGRRPATKRAPKRSRKK